MRSTLVPWQLHTLPVGQPGLWAVPTQRKVLTMAIVILPDSTRLDLLDDMAREVFGIADPDRPLDSTSDAYRWRWAMDELVQQMSEDEFRDALDYIARAHDVDVIELDSVAYTIMDALGCTVDAARGMREWIFDAVSDSAASLARLRADLEQFGAWYPDFKSLEEDFYTERGGVLYETQMDGAPVSCEADVWFDMSFGYFILWR